MEVLARTGVNAAKSVVLLGTLSTLVLVRSPLPATMLVGVVAVSLAGTYLVAPKQGAFRLWAAYVLGFVLFAHLRSVADETGIAAKADYVIDAERVLFAGQVPTVWLQEQLYALGRVGPLELLCVGVYVSYFVVPHALGLVLWKLDVASFRRYAFEILFAAYAGLAISFAVPTMPPWLAGQNGDLPFVSRVVKDVFGGGAGADAYREGYEIAGAVNPVAAMPSLHMALTVVVALAAWRLHRVAGVAASVYALSMGFALVYLGEHYAVDVLAGTAVAVAGSLIAARVLAKSPAEQAFSDQLRG
jgi:membrane-associated phospholipid phosphatase